MSPPISPLSPLPALLATDYLVFRFPNLKLKRQLTIALSATMEVVNGNQETIWGTTGHEKFAKTVALLHLLNKTPGGREDNDANEYIERTPEHQGGRAMTLAEEQKLTEYLSFISKVKHDPHRITALYVQEDGQGTGLTVTIAANRGDLDVIEKGFERVAEILMGIASDGKSKDRSAEADTATSLLREIILLTQGCIHSRLRSVHAKRRPYTGTHGPPGIPRIASALLSLTPARTSNIVSEADLAQLQTRAGVLQDLFTQLEQQDSTKAKSEDPDESATARELLMSIVKSAHELNSRYDLTALLGLSSDLSEEKKESLLKCTNKLSTYHSASIFLARAARRLPIFSKITINPLRPPSASKLPLPKQPQPTIADTLDVLFHALPEHRKERLESAATTLLSRKPSQKRPLSASDPRFCTLLTQSCPVHAEIQLLFHHYANPTPQGFPPPRVITSSKSACYLCNLFLHFHGGFYTPRTHGALYEKWTLPSKHQLPTEYVGVIAAVVDKMEEVLLSRVQVILEAGIKVVVGHPCESEAVVSMSGWSDGDSVLTARDDRGGTNQASNGISERLVEPPRTVTRFVRKDSGDTVETYVRSGDESDASSEASSRTSVGSGSTVGPVGRPSVRLIGGSGKRAKSHVGSADGVVTRTESPLPCMVDTEIDSPDPPPLLSHSLVASPATTQPSQPISSADVASAPTSQEEEQLQSQSRPRIASHLGSTGSQRGEQQIPQPQPRLASQPALVPQILKKGETICYALPPSHPVIKIHTGKLHATVLADPPVATELQGQVCYVQLRWLEEGEEAVGEVYRVKEMQAGKNGETEVDWKRLVLENGGERVSVGFFWKGEGNLEEAELGTSSALWGK